MLSGDRYFLGGIFKKTTTGNYFSGEHYFLGGIFNPYAAGG